MTKYTSNVDGLIEFLERVKQIYGGKTPVQVNAIGNDCVTGLTSVCVDDNEGKHEAIVYIETDLNGKTCSPAFITYNMSNRKI